jgi:aminopeptidase-like protein
MRSRYGDYPEYHTSLDDLESVVTPAGLQGGFDAVRECIDTLENEKVLITTNYGEPQLGPRGLYHSMLNKNTSDEVMLRTNILAYADGHHSIADIAELTGTSVSEVAALTSELEQHKLIKRSHQSCWDMLLF